MIETERLTLRPYREEDREAFAEINAHPEVGAWLAGVMDRAESDALMDRITAHIAEHGFGFFAAERKSDGRLVGAIGLKVMEDTMPVPGAIELGWRPKALSPRATGPSRPWASMRWWRSPPSPTSARRR